MNTDYSLPIEQWGSTFKSFQQVEKVKVNWETEVIDITIKGQDDILQATLNELDDTLYKFNSNSYEVIASFLRKNGILSYYQDTLVGFFDIHAYSTFIEKTKVDEAIKKLTSLFKKTKNIANTDLLAVKLNHWILSDSIILVIDTNRHPLFQGSLEIFLGTCSNIMRHAMINGLPLRGAIGGGDFYKDGEIMVSSGLVDAAQYEKKQNWLGAILTPKALELVEKAKKLENDLKGKTDIDFSLDRFSSFVRFGVIPWKDNPKTGEKPNKTYYIKPFNMAEKNWAEKYLPNYFEKQSKIENSNCLYSQL